MFHLKTKKQITAIFKKYGYTPTAIQGQHIPYSFMMFENYVVFVGRDVDLAGYQNLDKTHGRHEALCKIQYSYNMEKSAMAPEARNALADSYIERLSHAYENALREELKQGLVRVVYIPDRIDTNATVKSYYSDRKIHYAPFMTFIGKSEKEKTLKTMGKLFAEAYARPMPCYLISVYLGKPIEESEIPRIYAMMSEVFNILNTQAFREYRKKKNNKRYQHREDFKNSI